MENKYKEIAGRDETDKTYDLKKEEDVNQYIQ